MVHIYVFWLPRLPARHHSGHKHVAAITAIHAKAAYDQRSGNKTLRDAKERWHRAGLRAAARKHARWPNHGRLGWSLVKWMTCLVSRLFIGNGWEKPMGGGIQLEWSHVHYSIWTSLFADCSSAMQRLIKGCELQTLDPVFHLTDLEWKPGQNTNWHVVNLPTYA